MGGIVSTLQKTMAGAPPPPSGPFSMSSPESRLFPGSSCVFEKNGAKTYAKVSEIRGVSHTLAEAWDLPPDSAKCTFRYVSKAGERNISQDAQALEGANIDISNGELQLWYVQSGPIAAPIGFAKTAGGACTFHPLVHAVDIYVSVDGVDQTDGHICYGEPNLTRDEAIAKAVGKTIDSENWMASFLQNGPSDGSKPWATIVNDNKWQSDDSFVYLPLLANDVDDACLGEADKYPYIHSLVAKWAQLMKSSGQGEHTFRLRIRPRGIVTKDEDGSYWLGFTTGSCDDDKETAFYSSCTGQALTDAQAPGMAATWTMSLSAEQASGRGPVRKAQDFDSQWPQGELKECLDLAKNLANQGLCGSKAAEIAPGSTCDHIILTKGQAGSGIKEASRNGGERVYDYFCAWALFKHPDGGADSLGAQVKFVVKKYKVVDFKPVTEDWKSAGFENVSGEIVNGLTITNAEIDAAIQRDAQYY